MAYENNKTDFESALKELKEKAEGADPFISQELFEAIKSVTGEWESHFSSDLLSRENEYEELLEKKDELEEALAAWGEGEE